MARRGHNEGSIRLRADGRWEAQMTFDDGTGKIKRKSFYAKTRKEVAAQLTRALREREQGLPVGDERQMVGQFLTGWLETIAHSLDEGTLRRHEDNVRLHLMPTIGRVRLARLTAQQVQALYAAKLAEGLSTTTVHHLHATLHKALESAVRLGLIPRNVSKLVDVPRVREQEMHILSREEARVLLDITSGDRLAALYALALATGMRQGELLALRWRDVDLDEGVLRVRATLKRSRKTGAWLFTEPKTRRSRRQIALAPETVQALREHRARQAELRLFVGEAWQDLDLVFSTGAGGPLGARNVYRHFVTQLAHGGLPRVRFHDLRHTCATLLLAARVNPKVVSEMLGHASVSITLDIYSHVIPDMQQDAAATMARLLYG